MRHLCEVLVELHTTDISTLDPHGRLADPRGVGIDASSWAAYIDTTIDYYVRSFPDIDYDPSVMSILDLFLTLRRNIPRPLPLVLVHGDFNPANFLYEGGKVTALIDWENARIGDPREDLGWMTTMDILSNTHVMAHPVDEGGFLAYYNKLTGFDITQDEVDYFTLFGTANIAVPGPGGDQTPHRRAEHRVHAPLHGPGRRRHHAEPAPPARLSGGPPVNTSPSIDQMLEGVIISISTDIVPNLVNPKAHASAQMMQSILQGIRQLLPVYDQYLAEEHNQMMDVLRDVAATIGESSGPAAERIRDRAATLGQGAEVPIPLDRDAVMAAHRALGLALQANMIDLDELQRAGDADADAALEVIRGHMGPRLVRDVQTFLVGDAIVGRG